MTLAKQTTERGFVLYEFVDRYDEQCSLQESSLAEEACIWLGISPVQLKVFGWHPEYPARCRDMTEAEAANIHAHGRMHLTQEQAADLIPLLQHFVDTGQLP